MGNQYQGDLILEQKKEMITPSLIENNRFKLLPIKPESFFPIDKIKDGSIIKLFDRTPKPEKPTTVILFQHHFYLEKPLSLNKLLKMNILSAAPQTITEIDHIKYLKIKKEGGIDERFTVN